MAKRSEADLAEERALTDYFMEAERQMHPRNDAYYDEMWAQIRAGLEGVEPKPKAKAKLEKFFWHVGFILAAIPVVIIVLLVAGLFIKGIDGIIDLGDHWFTSHF